MSNDEVKPQETDDHLIGTDSSRIGEPIDADEAPRLAFPVVGVGASAGGLEAFIEFLKSVQPESGAAYVLIQHLPPDRDSLLTEILQKQTPLPVLQVIDGMKVEPNHIYVIRPGHTLTLHEGLLRLGAPVELHGHRKPVDDFFRSLAQEQRERAICVVLSGMGSNGTAGAQFIKAVGGLCIAQDPDSAKFPSMPRNLIDAGLTDFILKSEEIPAMIVRYASHPYAKRTLLADSLARRDREYVTEILALLRTRAHNDFSGYKKPTLIRRIHRRMGLHQFTSIADYLRLLRQNATEVTTLADDLMIHVTGFFRDPRVWESLRQNVIQPLVKERDEQAEIRAWVTACSTGEEAYTLAILLLEAASAAGKRFDIKIFATDTAERSLSHARAGIYPGGIESELTQERLSRFFDKDDAFYRIKKELRELVVFAPQNVVQDPPFSRLDICTCRNLLIYLEPEIQRRVLSLLHFGLREGGTLLLGTSETVNGVDDLFRPIDKKLRIYLRSGPTRHGDLDFPLPRGLSPRAETNPKNLRAIARSSVAQVAHKTLLDRFTPPSVVVDRGGTIVYFHGQTARFIDQPRGEPSRALFELTRESVRGALRLAWQQSVEKNETVTIRNGVISTGSGLVRIEVTVAPLDLEPKSPYFIVCFLEHPEPQTTSPSIPTSEISESLERELHRVRDELQSTIEELQTTNEEMKASNEEITSINEELQSSNEELETSKEELQSLNEELTTVNAQLQAKMEELERTTNDLSSLLSSTDIAVIFLDTRFRIRRFTPAVMDLIELIPADIGRPLSDLAQKFSDPSLLADCRKVLDRLVPIESEILSESGHWYVRRALPYRTADSRIDGVVITFVDITERKTAEVALRVNEERLRRVVATDTVGIAFFDRVGRITSANTAFLNLIGYSPEECQAGLISWDRITPPEWKQRALEAQHEFESAGRVISYEREYLHKDGSRWFGIYAATSLADGNGVAYALDITPRKHAEQEREFLLDRERKARETAERANHIKDEFLATVSHELRTPLSAILLWVKVLTKSSGNRSPREIEGLVAIEKSALSQQALINDLLDTTRISTGKLRLDPQDVNLAEVVRSAVEAVAPVAEARHLHLSADISSDLGVVRADANRMQQVVWNLLHNAVKYTPEPGRVDLTLTRKGNDVEIRITDTGIGIAPDFLSHIFQRFEQAEPLKPGTKSGLGLGLAISRQLIELHGGRLTAHSKGLGHGSTFVAVLPMPALRAIPDEQRAEDTGPVSLLGIHILLVEDDVLTGEALALLLTDAQAKVTKARDAAEAMIAYESHPPDVIVSDIGLPSADGHALMRQIRLLESSKGAPPVPAIALTAFAREQDARMALDSGYGASFSKPVDFHKLASEIAKTQLGRRS